MLPVCTAAVQKSHEAEAKLSQLSVVAVTSAVVAAGGGGAGWGVGGKEDCVAAIARS